MSTPLTARALVRTPAFWLHVALVLLALIISVPFIWALLNSFKTSLEIFSGTFLPRNWTVANYVAAWTTGRFGQNFLNSVIVSVATVVIELAIAVPAGYAFAKLWIGRFPPAFYVFLIGLAIPQEAFIINLFFQLREMKLINSLWGTILPTAAVATPLAILILRNAFRGLPNSLAEAAEIDGAGIMATFLQVMLPLARPAILVVAVLGFLDAWNEFLVSILVLVTPSVRTIPMGIFAFVDENGTNYGAIFAATVLSILPSLVVYIVFQRSFISGLSSGSVKE